MNKEKHGVLFYLPDKIKRSFKSMNWLVFFLLVFVLPVNANVFAQNEKISFQSPSLSVEEIFDEISLQLQYDVFYNSELLDLKRKIALEKTMSIEEVLKLIAGNKFSYNLEGKLIVLSPLKEAIPQVKEMKITGSVVDKNGAPLPGVTVLLKGTTIGTATDAEGKFSLACPEMEKVVLVFSFIGMESTEVTVTDPNTVLKVTLQESSESLEEVVVTGIFSRKKESFTGSASTYTSKELKTMGTRNVLQSLKTLDPAFAIIDNNEFGSDPNHLPNMEIRGKSSMLGMRDQLETDPNQPLFILDGFESTLSAINDLDINRIASITILKDAASTAIYGSKAANGVVVVETVKPESGKLQVNYSGNLNLSMPDLTSYNMMNAAEKLEFERLAGRYSDNDNVETEIELDALYQEKLQAIASGVDTYWLAEPLRVGVNQTHSLYVQGGEGNFIFGLGAGYNGNSGVMNKSLREVVSGNIDLIYRVSKFQFSNKFSMNVTNMTNPIVSFSEYANANPYFKKRNDDGTVEKWLENNDYFQSPNPLYNDNLNSRDEGKNVSISNYFVAEFMPTNAWKVRGRFGYTYGNNDTENFLSPNDTSFDEVEITRKGRYTATNTRINTYEGELSVTFGKVFEKHQVNLVAGGNIYGTESLTQGYSATGFPEGDFSYPSFSNGYPENGTPTYFESVSHSLNAYFNGGYVYDNRYLMDVSLRTSGTSVFGNTQKYNTTWSVWVGISTMKTGSKTILLG